jgi:hypothetical protein
MDEHATTAYYCMQWQKFHGNGPKGIDVQFSKDGKAQSIKTMKTIADRLVVKRVRIV